MTLRSTRLLVLVGASGSICALAPGAMAEDPLLADAPMKAGIAGHVYINARTGERTVTTTPTTSRSDMNPRFVNEDFDGNGQFFWGLDNPTLTFPTTVGGGQRIGGEAADWGDIEFDTVIDAFRAANWVYAVSPIGPFGPVPGLDMTLWYFDCDNGINDPDAIPVTSITIEDLNSSVDPTLPDAWVYWIYTVDLAGSGLEFELGDTDGTYTGISGQSSTGCDKDDTNGDPHADFGWSYTFQQNQEGPKSTMGPLLVLPTNTGEEGVEDAFDLYKNPSGGAHDLHASTLFFGGWPVAPFASFYLGLYGPNPRDCGPADFNGDTTVDVLDFLDFIDDFSNCEGQPAPCGTIANTDLGGDTIVDILDFLDFFDVFGACE